jgi:molybdenum cofactor cytidylyltransferase
MNHPDIVPLVLAAGEGQRMGGNKALLDLGGTPALLRLLETARAAGVGQPIAVLGHEADRVRPLLDGLPVTPVVNPEPDRGQTSSVQAALAAVPATASGVLVWPVDLILVTVEDVAAIAGAARDHPQATVVLPSHGGRSGHPAFLRRSLFAAVLALPPEVPLHTLVRGERDRTYFVERPTDSVLRDVNRTTDLNEARRDLSGERPVRP